LLDLRRGLPLQLRPARSVSRAEAFFAVMIWNVVLVYAFGIVLFLIGAI
jgi:hypothetical protein